MNQQYSKPQLWLGLLRPKTLFSSLSAVMVAVVYASTQVDVNWLLASLLALLAVSAQISSNIANDLIDYRKGADTEERKGPLRPLSKGLISTKEVYCALGISLSILVVSGLLLLSMSSWWLGLVGLAVLAGIFAYSGGPYPLSYNGLGDVAVLIFFGLVPVVVSGYILGLNPWDTTLWHLGASIGLASVNILVVNNYRDYEEDKATGKRTLIVRFGKDFAPRLYMTCGLLSVGLLYPIYSPWGWLLIIVYILLFSRAYQSMQRSTGSQLNGTLALTARNVFLLALVIAGLLLLRSL